MDVIDVSSSPDTSPKLAAKPFPLSTTNSNPKKRALPLFIPEESEYDTKDSDPDVIELTDTEEEDERPEQKKRRISSPYSGNGNESAGPSSTVKAKIQFVVGSSKGKGDAIASESKSSSRVLRSNSSIEIIRCGSLQ